MMKAVKHLNIRQEVLSKWKHFNDEQRQFDQWLNEKEQVLARMRSVDMKEVNEVIEQVRQLKVSQYATLWCWRWLMGLNAIVVYWTHIKLHTCYFVKLHTFHYVRVILIVKNTNPLDMPDAF